MTEREMLEQAAKDAGVTLRMGCNDDDHHAVVLWRSTGPMIRGTNSNRCLICHSHEEAMIAVEFAGRDLKKASTAPGYFNA